MRIESAPSTRMESSSTSWSPQLRHEGVLLAPLKGPFAAPRSNPSYPSQEGSTHDTAHQDSIGPSHEGQSLDCRPNSPAVSPVPETLQAAHNQHPNSTPSDRSHEPPLLLEGAPTAEDKRLRSSFHFPHIKCSRRKLPSRIQFINLSIDANVLQIPGQFPFRLDLSLQPILNALLQSFLGYSLSFEPRGNVPIERLNRPCHIPNSILISILVDGPELPHQHFSAKVPKGGRFSFRLKILPPLTQPRRDEAHTLR